MWLELSFLNLSSAFNRQIPLSHSARAYKIYTRSLQEFSTALLVKKKNEEKKHRQIRNYTVFKRA